ncbi:Glycosyl phosphatidyl inositol protein transamidase complex subunit [Microbotryomycetes sp. JL201]|nr:Glycosyl phosphatidyl inositol protein transamidase complex subunit [Microbotryomycetes sp. JL201]
MTAVAAKLRAAIAPGADMYSRTKKSLVRREKIMRTVNHLLPVLGNVLVVIGLAYLVVLPHPALGRRHYISENALQPAQVNTYWNWADVHVADLFADDVAAWVERNLTSDQRSREMTNAFHKLGLPSATQTYAFKLGNGRAIAGTNAYAIFQAPKTDGVEAMVLSASWLSREKDQSGRRRINYRGISTVLSMANYLKKSSYWSKDIVFLLSDGYLDGTQAWLDAFHGYKQSNSLSLSTGGIWAALNVDYPHHSFSHIGLFYEGTNGHLTNLDFVNSATSILKHIGVPVVLHSDVSFTSGEFGLNALAAVPDPARKLFDNGPTMDFVRSSLNMARQLCICALGAPAGPEGLYGKYRIDALTFFGVPADGPHGFHALGRLDQEIQHQVATDADAILRRRAIESMFRSLNNLLERFHQSFFLYIMTSTDTFVTVGNYLASPILVGAGLTLHGLATWSSTQMAGCARPVTLALAIIASTHVLGALAFFGWLNAPIKSFEPISLLDSVILLMMGAPFILKALPPPIVSGHALSRMLLSFTLLLAGLALSIVATLNFGAAVALSLALPCPLLLALHISKRPQRTTFGQVLVSASLPMTLKLVQAAIAAALL